MTVRDRSVAHSAGGGGGVTGHASESFAERIVLLARESWVLPLEVDPQRSRRDFVRAKGQDPRACAPKCAATGRARSTHVSLQQSLALDPSQMPPDLDHGRFWNSCSLSLQSQHTVDRRMATLRSTWVAHRPLQFVHTAIGINLLLL